METPEHFRQFLPHLEHSRMLRTWSDPAPSWWSDIVLAAKVDLGLAIPSEDHHTH